MKITIKISNVLPYSQFHNKAFVLDKTVTKKLCLMLLFCYNENDEIGIYWGNKTFKVPEQVFLFVFSTPLVSV